MPRFRRQRKKIRSEIQPDEIFIDSANVAELDVERFEGRIERPLGSRTFLFVLCLASLFVVFYMGRALDLQLIHGVAYAKQAAENKLAEQVVFADRGIIADRMGRELAGNARASVEDDFASRVYAPYVGLGHVIGYTKAPAKDSSGFYFRDSYIGIDGIEQIFNKELSGTNGLRLTETDARGKVVSESTQRVPEPGKKITLSVDAEITQGLHDAIVHRAEESGFQGGAGVIMDVETGEIIALTSYPEFSPQALSSGDQAALEFLLTDKRQPFLDRAVNGLYAPGSIVKPIVGLAALTEGVIDQHKEILSTGSISVPNPYNPSKPSIFKDWKAHGLVDLRRAIAVSSDVYFYEVGGGYQTQKGIGIEKLDYYFRLFGFGSPTGLMDIDEPSGTIPTPEWKLKTFNGDPWRLGDTYNTAIGQYGMQMTPMQAVRAAAAIANGGSLLTPTLLASSTPKVEKHIDLPQENFQIVREGMRMGVTDGIAQAMKLPYVEVAAKTGTAQVGAHNEYINSWVIGFFPASKPKYAFAMVLEKGPAHTTVGAAPAMGQFFIWLNQNQPQFLK
ncbi:MAG: penicillin-binding transpeptidase domain-containing protein [Patescibacteria group bacterium]